MADPAPEPIDRRPIAARNLPFSRIVAGWLPRHGVSANAISIAGLAAGSTLAATVWLTSWELRLAWLLGRSNLGNTIVSEVFIGFNERR